MRIINWLRRTLAYCVVLLAGCFMIFMMMLVSLANDIGVKKYSVSIKKNKEKNIYSCSIFADGSYMACSMDKI